MLYRLIHQHFNKNNLLKRIVLTILVSTIVCINNVFAQNVDMVNAPQESPERLFSGHITKVDSAKLDQITKQILEKEIEFERLNTSFRMETTLVSPWRQRRVFVYGEANACGAEAASIISLPILYKLSNPKTMVSARQGNNFKSQLMAAARCSLVGQAVGMGGDILELSLNFLNYQSIKKRNFDPHSYAIRVHALRLELDNLIEERKLLVVNSANLSACDRNIASAEGKLLDDIRDLSLLEYSRFHSATRRFWTFQNTAFVVDLLKNSTAMSGSIITLAANHLNRRHLFGSAGVMAIVNGAIILATPSVGRVTGNLSGLAAARTASKELTHMQADNARDYSAHSTQFVAMTNENKESTPYTDNARKRQVLYADAERSATSMQQFLLNQRKRSAGTLRENIVFAGIVGPPRVAGGIENMLSSWKYYNNRVRASRLSAAGATGNLVGSSFAIFETARVAVSAELYNKRQAKSNLLPKQQFMQRLATLNEMEAALNH